GIGVPDPLVGPVVGGRSRHARSGRSTGGMAGEHRRASLGPTGGPTTLCPPMDVAATSTSVAGGSPTGAEDDRATPRSRGRGADWRTVAALAVLALAVALPLRGL